MHQIIVKFFVDILQSNRQTLELVEKYDGDMRFDSSSNVLVFKLQSLHELLFEAAELDYSSFRKLIYQGNLNEELASLGGRVEVHQSTGNVDDNFYRLVKL